MPLLRRQRFEKAELPEDLQPNEELFYNQLTKEAFRDYDAFFERVILCNSLVWTCELTGRPGLTYLEAIESEERARNSLLAIPVALKRTLLYLACLSNCGRLSDLCDDVFNYVKERFFVGEEVEAVVRGERRVCKIVKVIAPSSGKRKASSSGSAATEFSKSDGDDPETDGSHSDLDPNSCQYQVCDCEDPDRSLHFLTPDDILRKKGVYSREKNRLFLKHACELCDNLWIVKNKFLKKYNIEDMKFKDIFAGDKPNFQASVNKKKQNCAPLPGNGGSKSKNKDPDKKAKNKKKADGKLPVKKKDVDKSHKVEQKKTVKSKKEKEPPAVKEVKPSLEDKKKAKEELKQKLEEERKKKKEEKDKEREKLREERRIMAECLREWQKPRDDLQCDDLLDLPSTVPIECGFSNDLFGEAVMVLEFVNNFSDHLSASDRFPQGLTFEMLVKALVEKDVQGPFNDLLQLLLQAIFTLQEEEENDGESSLDGANQNSDLSNGNSSMSDNGQADLSTAHALKLATVAATWPMYYHGTGLHSMSLDAFTLTEILRLHILASGSHSNSLDYSPHSDPGLLLRVNEPGLLQALSSKSVFDLTPGDKLKVLKTLIDQLLSYLSLRDEVEERLEKLRIAKLDLKQWQWAEQRREREEAALKFRRKLEERAKLDNMNGMIQCETSENKDALNKEIRKDKTKNSKDEDKTPENSDKPSEMELQLKKEKLAAKEAKRKGEFLKKEKELSDVVATLQNRGSLVPMGRDRAYRRFWMFNFLPGLFVEDDDDTVGTCLSQPTPYNPNSNPYMSFNNSIARHQAQKITSDQGSNASDKENEAKVKVNAVQNTTSSIHKNHKLLSDNHPTINGFVDNAKLVLDRIKVDHLGAVIESGKSNTIFGMCTSAGESCPVHGSRRRTTWSFYPTPAKVEALIASLNPRGFREGSLKEILVAEKRKVVQSVHKCPVACLNPSVTQEDLDSSAQSDLQKSSKIQSSQSTNPLCPTADSFLELTFRDSILDIEEKIYAGGLGSIKVANRAAWKDTIMQNLLERQNEMALPGASDTKLMNGHCSDSDTLDDAKEKRLNAICEDGVLPPATDSLVGELSLALLQIFKGIEPKYLLPPFVIEKDVGDSGSKPLPQKSFAERWEESLMSSSSFSQLFVHLATLEKSVAWSKSILNARCRICRRKKDAEHMLLCDGCDRGHHMYCLKPPLKEIPEGDWLCTDCCPKEKPQRRRRKRRLKEEDVDYVDDEQPNSKMQEMERLDETVAAEEAALAVDEKSDAETEHIDLCCVCQQEGLLICCVRCPLTYHLECLDPPLKKIPRGRWLCPKCPSRRHKRRTITEGEVLPLNSVKSPKRRRRTIATSSPRRSERNVGRKISYEHSRYYFDDIWSSGRKFRRCSHLFKEDLSDLEYYGLTRRHITPIRRGASQDVPLDFKTCDELLTELVRHEDCWPFLRPVGRREIPNYYEIVKRPMDFGTMRSKLNAMVYQSNKEFVADVFLVFQNCCIFNPSDSIQFKAAETLGSLFYQRIQDLKLNLSADTSGAHFGFKKRRRRRRRRLMNAGRSSDDEEEESCVTDKRTNGEMDEHSPNNVENDDVGTSQCEKAVSDGYAKFEESETVNPSSEKNYSHDVI